MSRRVVFTFDDRSLECLTAMKVVGKYSTLADVIRDSLLITRAIQAQIGQGYGARTDGQLNSSNGEYGKEGRAVL